MIIVRAVGLAFRSILIGLVGIACMAASTYGMDQSAPKSTRDWLVRVGSSSIWISKGDYDRFKAGIALPWWIEIRGQISRADIPVFKAILAPYLDPKYLQTHPRPRWFKPEPDEVGFSVSLDSQGGDVTAALELGRMFRKARVSATVGINGECLSSCVFLLAGAVERLLTFEGRIGIHRPYFGDTARTTFESLQNRTTQLGKAVSEYLNEMNIPSALYDAMTRVPPEQIKILDRDELELYGLKQDDPVFAELKRKAEARAVGLPMSEYLPRKAAYDKCVDSSLIQWIRERGPKPNSASAEIEAFGKARDECINTLTNKSSQP